MASSVLVSSLLELDRALDESAHQPVWVFKHSLICSVSVWVRKAWDEFVEGRSDGALYAVIEIQNAREVSDELARRTGVKHESPQVLLLKDGKAVWSASHWDISRESLEAASGVGGT
ncbi:MAG: bacillithiol system redox-active protein YtxJ [Candidatus Eiseniibacteriota bacterium]